VHTHAHTHTHREREREERTGKQKQTQLFTKLHDTNTYKPVSRVCLTEGESAGETDIDQLQRVLALRGTPDVWLEDWPEVEGFPDYDKVSFAPMAPQDLAPMLETKEGGGQPNPHAVDLADTMLQIAPSKRGSCASALEHVWFGVEPPPQRIAAHDIPSREERQRVQREIEEAEGSWDENPLYSRSTSASPRSHIDPDCPPELD